MDTTRICKLCREPLAKDAEDEICPQCVEKAEIAELAPHFTQYDIHQRLGKGGMGIVYKAFEPGLKRFVALKILAPQFGGEPAFAERFRREAQALAKLNHPGIVHIHAFGHAGPYYYFTMEFVDGMNLRQKLNRGSIPLKQTQELVIQICTALQYAHDQDLVHRDIKPENILLNNEGQVKIADFGVAKLLGRTPHPRLTASEVAMGTENYMAPEQRKDAQSVDHRADIYSLGVVFYEMLTGELPMGLFPRPSQKAQMDAQVGARVDEVVLCALQSEAERRYQKASEIKTRVEAIIPVPAAPVATADEIKAGVEATTQIADTPVPDEERPPPKTRRFPVWRLLSIAALLALAVWLRPYLPDLLDLIRKPGPARLVERAREQLERYDLPGHVDRALRDLEEAKQEDPGYTDAQAWLGMAHWRRYRLTDDLSARSEAERFSSDALKLNQDSGPALFVQGLVAADKGNFQLATNFLYRASEKFSWENGEVLVRLAAAYWSLSDPTNGLIYIHKASEASDQPWYFYNSLGSFEFSLGQYPAAQSNFEQAVHLAEDSPNAWLNLGMVLLAQTDRNENERARQCFETSLRLHSSDAAYDGLGELYMNTSNWLNAALNFQKAARLNLDRYDLPGKEGLALIRLQGANYQVEARELLGKAVDKARSEFNATTNSVDEANLGLYHAALGETIKAYDTLRHAMELSPNDPQVEANVEAAADYLRDVHHLSGEAEHILQLLPKKPDKK